MTPLRLNIALSSSPNDVPPSAWTGHLPFAFWAVKEARPRVLVHVHTDWDAHPNPLSAARGRAVGVFRAPHRGWLERMCCALARNLMPMRGA